MLPVARRLERQFDDDLGSNRVRSVGHPTPYDVRRRFPKLISRLGVAASAPSVLALPAGRVSPIRGRCDPGHRRGWFVASSGRRDRSSGSARRSAGRLRRAYVRRRRRRAGRRPAEFLWPARRSDQAGGAPCRRRAADWSFRPARSGRSSDRTSPSGCTAPCSTSTSGSRAGAPGSRRSRRAGRPLTRPGNRGRLLRGHDPKLGECTRKSGQALGLQFFNPHIRERVIIWLGVRYVPDNGRHRPQV